MSAASAQQIKAIHALKSQAGLDEDSYRDFLQQQAGVRSAKRLAGTGDRSLARRTRQKR